MLVSARLKAVADRARKAEINMAIDEYDKLVKRIQLLCDNNATEKIMADLHFTIAQSKVMANRIYELRHKN